MRRDDDIRTQEERFRRTVQENPVLFDLCERFGLVFEESGRPVIETEQTRREALSGLADRCLKRNRIYTSEQVVSLLAVGLSISQERAKKGLNMMIEQGVLTVGRGERISFPNRCNNVNM